MTNWKKYKLGDVVQIIDSLHQTPKYLPVGFPMVRVTEIKGGALNLDGTYKVSQEVFEKFSKRHKSTEGDLVMSRVGTYRGIVSYVQKNQNFCLGQNTLFIVPKINSKFIYYYLVSPKAKEQIENFSTGSSQKTISLKSISEIDIQVPTEETQIRIASILSSLDDKIELNRRMNATLEQMAATLFKKYFVDDIDPDNLPEGWRWGKIGDIIDVKGGTTPSTKDPLFWNGNLSWTSPRDLSKLNTPVLLETEKKITEAGLKKVSSGLLPIGTLLLSSRAPIGYLAITQIPVAINQGYIAIICSKKIVSNLFMLFWLKENMDIVIQNSNGSTFLEISKSVFRNIDIIIPSKKVLTEFDNQIAPVFQQIVINEKENKILVETRDTLLPKLMSGEIDVSSINQNETLHESVLS